MFFSPCKKLKIFLINDFNVFLLSLENSINTVACGSNKFYMIGPCNEPFSAALP